MALVSHNMVVDAVAVAVTIYTVIYIYFQWSFKYWQRKGIPFIKPRFPYGALTIFSTPPQAMPKMLKVYYDEFKSKGQHQMGIYFFSRPVYVPLDVKHIKDILIKDFDHFVDRGVYYNEKDDPLSGNLFSLEGNKWKKLRTMVTPAFSLGKIRTMFSILIECSENLKGEIDIKCAHGETINVKDVISRFSINVIGSSAFGIDCNSIANPDSEFVKYGKRFINLKFFDLLKIFVGFAVPSIAKALRLKAIPIEVSDFFMKIIDDTVKYREENNVVRNDFLQLLIDIKNSEKSDERLTMPEIAAQAFLFFAAGYETTSTTIAFSLFELCQNLEVQQKARDEINGVLKRYKGVVTYEAVTEMKYVGQIVDETLRKYPPLMALNRICIKDYNIPETDILIEKGTLVLIPVFALHQDPEYFPNPENFDPARFTEQNKNKIKSCVYLPFGEGPRNCVAIRFGIIEAKVCLAVLLKNYKFILNPKTKVPLEMDPFSFVYNIKEDILVDMEHI